ncbi:hypothetical protein JW711_03680 [Candidatus Woesearchaeota archaeon]|nr:hypothetical protein [Candidatus Woesearchaeota archaeon]
MASFNRPSDLPVDQVKTLRSRGFDNNQIVQALQRNGYSSTQIFDALNQADLVGGAAPGSPVPDMGSAPMGGPDEPPPPDAAGAVGADEPMDEQIDEMIESIVEEKWNAVSKDFSGLMDWKGEVDSKIIKINQRIDTLQESFDKLHQAIIGKVGEYDKNILAVGAEIKAMERVFAKVLPVFTENVNELNRITQGLKKK